MNKRMLRIMVVLLVPCLVMDPALAAALNNPLAHFDGSPTARHGGVDSSLFARQAFASRAREFPYQRLYRQFTAGFFESQAELLRAASPGGRDYTMYARQGPHIRTHAQNRRYIDPVLQRAHAGEIFGVLKQPVQFDEPAVQLAASFFGHAFQSVPLSFIFRALFEGGWVAAPGRTSPEVNRFLWTSAASPSDPMPPAEAHSSDWGVSLFYRVDTFYPYLLPWGQVIDEAGRIVHEFGALFDLSPVETVALSLVADLYFVSSQGNMDHILANRGLDAAFQGVPELEGMDLTHQNRLIALNEAFIKAKASIMRQLQEHGGRPPLLLTRSSMTESLSNSDTRRLAREIRVRLKGERLESDAGGSTDFQIAMQGLGPPSVEQILVNIENYEYRFGRPWRGVRLFSPQGPPEAVAELLEYSSIERFAVDAGVLKADPADFEFAMRHLPGIVVAIQESIETRGQDKVDIRFGSLQIHAAASPGRGPRPVDVTLMKRSEEGIPPDWSWSLIDFTGRQGPRDYTQPDSPKPAAPPGSPGGTQSIPPGGAGQAGGPERRLNILVVEDDFALVEMYRTLLELLGHSISIAFDGVEALAKFDKEHTDLVILDLLIPGMDAFDVIQALRQLQPRLHVIICSGIITPNVKALAEKFGVGWLEKPFSDLKRPIQEEMDKERIPPGRFIELKRSGVLSDVNSVRFILHELVQPLTTLAGLGMFLRNHLAGEMEEKMDQLDFGPILNLLNGWEQIRKANVANASEIAANPAFSGAVEAFKIMILSPELSRGLELLIEQVERMDPKNVQAPLELTQGLRALEVAQAITRSLDQYFISRNSRGIREPVAIKELIQRITPAFSGGLQIEIREPEGNKPLWVIADEEELYEVMLNLLRNAREAGAGKVTLEFSRTGAEGVVTLQDDGHGMSEDTLRRITQGRFSTKKDSSAIGLELCASILHAVGGSMEIESALHVGTTVRIRLPAAPVSPELSRFLASRDITLRWATPEEVRQSDVFHFSSPQEPTVRDLQLHHVIFVRPGFDSETLNKAIAQMAGRIMAQDYHWIAQLRSGKLDGALLDIARQHYNRRPTTPAELPMWRRGGSDEAILEQMIAESFGQWIGNRKGFQQHYPDAARLFAESLEKPMSLDLKNEIIRQGMLQIQASIEADSLDHTIVRASLEAADDLAAEGAGARAAVPVLIQAARDTRGDKFWQGIRRNFIAALVRIDPQNPDVEKTLGQILDSALPPDIPEWVDNARNAAARALAYRLPGPYGPETMQALTKGSTDPDPWIASVCRDGLKRFSSGPASTNPQTQAGSGLSGGGFLEDIGSSLERTLERSRGRNPEAAVQSRILMQAHSGDKFSGGELPENEFDALRALTERQVWNHMEVENQLELVSRSFARGAEYVIATNEEIGSVLLRILQKEWNQESVGNKLHALVMPLTKYMTWGVALEEVFMECIRAALPDVRIKMGMQTLGNRKDRPQNFPDRVFPGQLKAAAELSRDKTYASILEEVWGRARAAKWISDAARPARPAAPVGAGSGAEDAWMKWMKVSMPTGPDRGVKALPPALTVDLAAVDAEMEKFKAMMYANLAKPILHRVFLPMEVDSQDPLRMRLRDYNDDLLVIAGGRMLSMDLESPQPSNQMSIHWQGVRGHLVIKTWTRSEVPDTHIDIPALPGSIVNIHLEQASNRSRGRLILTLQRKFEDLIPPEKREKISKGSSLGIRIEFEKKSSSLSRATVILAVFLIWAASLSGLFSAHHSPRAPLVAA